jgi:DNA-binding MarR family transcriptional regulator
MASIGPGAIDPIIHGRLRLGIMVYLADADVAAFTELKAALGVTQGNLSAGLIQLESAGYVRIEKGFVGRKPRTQARVTPAGRVALAAYLKEMAALAERLG